MSVEEFYRQLAYPYKLMALSIVVCGIVEIWVCKKKVFPNIFLWLVIVAQVCFYGTFIFDSIVANWGESRLPDIMVKYTFRGYVPILLAILTLVYFVPIIMQRKVLGSKVTAIRTVASLLLLYSLYVSSYAFAIKALWLL